MSRETAASGGWDGGAMPRRPLLRRGDGMLLGLAGLVSVFIASTPDALAANRAACPVNSDPYRASAEVRQVCGTRGLPARSTTSLPYGGTPYNYEQPNGQIRSEE